MKINTITINGIAALLVLTLSGAASADIGSEAGNWEYRNESVGAKAHNLAKNYEYDATALSKVGSEAGNWEYRFDVPKTSAEIASQDYQYNEDALHRIGSEAGNWEYQPVNSGQNSNKSVAEKDNQKALCSKC